MPNCIDKHSHSFSGDMLMLTSRTKLLAVLTLGSTITLGACAMDDANSDDDTQQSTDSADATVDPQGASPIVPAATLTNTIRNDWPTGSLGVILAHDGVYKIDNNYDALLKPGQDTFSALHWGTTAGFFIGPNWCAHLMRSDNGGPWTMQADVPFGQHFIGAHTSYRVTPFPC